MTKRNVSIILEENTKEELINKNKEHLILEDAITKVSKLLLSSKVVDLDQVLKIIGETIDVSRAFIFRFCENNEKIDKVNLWVAPGVKSTYSKIQGLDLKPFKSYFNRLQEGESIIVNDLYQYKVSDESIEAKNILLSFDESAVIFVPIISNNKQLIGVMGFVDTEKSRDWSESDVRILQMVSEMVASYWYQLEAEIIHRKVFNNTGTAIVILNQAGIIVEVNKEFERISGFSKKEIECKKHFKEFVYSDDREKMVNFHRQRWTNKGNIPDKYSFKFINRDQEISDIFISVVLIPGTKRSVASLLDITERIKLEKELSESEELFRRSFQESTIGMGILDIDGNFIKLNQVLCEMLGYTREELQKLYIIDIIHPDDKERSLKTIDELLNGKYNTAKFEKRYLRKNGDIVWVLLNISLIRDEDNNPLFFLSQIENISERKAAQIKLEHQLKLERIVAEISNEFIIKRNPDFERILALLGRASEADKTYIFQYEGDEGRIVKTHQWSASGIKPQIDDLQNFSIDNISRWMEDLKKRDDIVIVDFDQKQPTASEENMFLQTRSVKSLLIPIYSSDEKLIALLGFEDTKEYSIFSDMGILKIVREMFVRYWEREESKRKLKKSYNKLEKVMESTVYTLASIVEMRDPYTAGHQERVAELAFAIGKEMGLTLERIKGLRTAGLLHDIGKIRVPSEILTKSGKLSETEFMLIKEHSQNSYEILKEIEFDQPIAKIVLQHHERLDGSGYPGGLKGNEILLEARILAVADVVEAISSHRPYRAALGIDIALEEISKNKGSKYDAEVVNTCFRLFREKGFRFE